MNYMSALFDRWLGAALAILLASSGVAPAAEKSGGSGFDANIVADKLEKARRADQWAKQHPEPAIPGHYPQDKCTDGRTHWVTPVQGYILDWCAITVRDIGKGNFVVTAFVDAPIKRGFETIRSTVRYDFDCGNYVAINQSPPFPIDALGPVSAPYLIEIAVCLRARELLHERNH